MVGGFTQRIPSGVQVEYIVHTWEKRNVCVCNLLSKIYGFIPNFVCITMQYRLKAFISGVIENKLRKEQFDSVRIGTFGY